MTTKCHPLRALACAAFLTISVLHAAPESIEDCDERVRRQPRDRASLECYEKAACRSGRWTEAIGHLQALLDRDPGNHRGRFHLARMESELGKEEAEGRLRSVIIDSRIENDLETELYARLDLFWELARRGRSGEAGAEIAEAAKLAERTGDPVHRAGVRLREAWRAINLADYGTAEGILPEIESDLFPDGPVRLRSEWLKARCWAAWFTGQKDVAFDSCGARLELMREVGDRYHEAAARYDIAMLESTDTRGGITGSHKEWLGRIRDVMDLAVASGNREYESKCLLNLAAALPTKDKRRYLERALEIQESTASVLSDPLRVLQMLGSSLIKEEPRDPSRGLAMLDEVVERAAGPQSIVFALSSRASHRWWLVRKAGRGDLRQEAIERSLETLDAIEALGDSQMESITKARVRSWWTSAYDVLAANLLWPVDGKRSAAELEQAFNVLERKRAGVMLQDLGSVPPERSRPDIPSLTRVRGALGENEALLAYQVTFQSDWGASAVIVITREKVEVFAVPSRHSLERSIDLFLGLLPNRDGSELRGAVRLHGELLEEALAGLPPRVTHLIIVPDGVLNRLPFGALRPTPDGEPVGTQFTISVVPSTAIWLHLRGVAVDTPRYPALALVDPDLTRAREDEPAESVRLDPLPEARDEARSMARSLGGDSRILAGAEATERFMKESDLRPYGVIHFATHAVVDESQPRRSALLLTPGSDSEDGRLEARELMGMDLGGRVVVLSACRSASGKVLDGEGVLSLARPFLVSGASAVVGSLLRLRDDDAAAVLSHFYRHLGEGLSLEEALRAARADRIRAGEPAEAWAGLTLIGNGSLVPFPGGREEPRSTWQLAGILSAALIAAGFLVRRVHRLHASYPRSIRPRFTR